MIQGDKTNTSQAAQQTGAGRHRMRVLGREGKGRLCELEREDAAGDDGPVAACRAHRALPRPVHGEDQGRAALVVGPLVQPDLSAPHLALSYPQAWEIVSPNSAISSSSRRAIKSPAAASVWASRSPHSSMMSPGWDCSSAAPEPLDSTTTWALSSWSSGTASTSLWSCSRVGIAAIVAPPMSTDQGPQGPTTAPKTFTRNNNLRSSHATAGKQENLGSPHPPLRSSIEERRVMHHPNKRKR